MHDAGLNDRARKDRLGRFRETLQAVDDGDQDVADAAVLELDRPSRGSDKPARAATPFSFIMARHRLWLAA